MASPVGPRAWLSSKGSRARAFLNWLPERLSLSAQEELLRRMRQGLYLAASLSVCGWLVVGLTRPGARARALRIAMDRQWAMADRGAEAYFRGARQAVAQANAVASTGGLTDEDRAARLTDLRRVALDLGARHLGWQRIATRFDAARQSVPARIWPQTQVVDPATGLQVRVGSAAEQLARQDLQWLIRDPAEQSFGRVASHWAAPGAPPLPQFDASTEFQ